MTKIKNVFLVSIVLILGVITGYGLARTELQTNSQIIGDKCIGFLQNSKLSLESAEEHFSNQSTDLAPRNYARSAAYGIAYQNCVAYSK